MQEIEIDKNVEESHEERIERGHAEGLDGEEPQQESHEERIERQAR